MVMARAPRRKRRRRGRPRKKESEVTVVEGRLISMALPDGKKDFEMVSPDVLLTKKGFKVYRDMGADDIVKASLYYKKALIAARPFDIVPAGTSEEDKKAAKFIEEDFARLNFDDLLFEMLSAFQYGHSVGELIWDIDDLDDGFGLKLHIDNIKFRDPEFMFIRTDDHGNITNFVQKPAIGMLSAIPTTGIKIDPEKVIHYAYQREFSNHYGVSDLRAAYRAWWSKRYVTQFYNVFLERFGSPLMKMSYPVGGSETLKASLKEIMRNLSSKTDILVPEGVIIDLVEATRGGTATYAEALLYYDNRIATAILVPSLLGFGTDPKRGTDSQSRLHLRTLMKVVQHVGKEIEQEINTKIIKPIIEANFNVKPPKMVFQDYGEFESFEISNAIKELHNAGILELDEEDTNYTRSILGLPVREQGEEDKVDRPPQQPPLGAGPDVLPGAKDMQGNKQASKGASERKTKK